MPLGTLSGRAASEQQSVLLTDEELAAMLRIKVQTLRARRVRGEAPPHVKMGRMVRTRLSDVERWLDELTRRSTSDHGDARRSA